MGELVVHPKNKTMLKVLSWDGIRPVCILRKGHFSCGVDNDLVGLGEAAECSFATLVA